MSILDPGSFKKSFEKAERYATAALEIKKLSDAKKAVKDAKAGAVRKQAADTLQQQIARTKRVLESWEEGLSAPFAALVGSKKVYEALSDESDAVKKVLAKEGAAKGEDEQLSVAKQVGMHEVALDNLERDLKSLVDYGDRLRAALPAINDGSIGPDDTLKLVADGKKQVESRDKLKTQYLKSRKEFAEKAGPGSELTSVDKDALKKLLKRLGDNLRKIEAVPDIDPALDKLKAQRKKMLANKAGLVALFAQLTHQGDDASKELEALDEVIVSVGELLKGYQQRYPDPKTANLPANKLKERKNDLSLFQRTLEFRLRTVGTNIRETGEKIDAFAKRADKVLAVDGYKDVAKHEADIAKSGAEMAKRKVDMATRLAALRPKAIQAIADGNAASAFIKDRLADYVDADAQSQLEKKG